MASTQANVPANVPAIKLTEVHKYYEKNHVLRGINLNIHQGEFFGLLGVNGAGKSTLIGIIAGLIKVSSGSCSIFSNDTLTHFRQARRNIGLVPQELVNEPFLAIRQLLKLQSGYFGIKADSQWIDEILDHLGLMEKADATLSSLSGGMKRRFLIAMAIVHKPQVIILDEPTAGVDVNQRKKIWTFINELHQQGHTIILTTHYLEEAESLCNRIVIIDNGAIIVDRDKQQILSENQGQSLEKIFLDYVNV